MYNSRLQYGPRYINHRLYTCTVKYAFNIRLESVVQTKRLSSNAGNEKRLQVAPTDDAIIQHKHKCMRANVLTVYGVFFSKLYTTATTQPKIRQKHFRFLYKKLLELINYKLMDQHCALCYVETSRANVSCAKSCNQKHNYCSVKNKIGFFTRIRVML